MGYSGSFAVNSSSEFAEILSAMGNGKRIEILRLLLQGEMSVGILARSIGLTQSATSQHLARLSAVDLVTKRRAGQTIYYKVTSGPVRHLVELCGADFVSAPPRGDDRCRFGFCPLKSAITDQEAGV